MGRVKSTGSKVCPADCAWPNMQQRHFPSLPGTPRSSKIGEASVQDGRVRSREACCFFWRG